MLSTVATAGETDTRSSVGVQAEGEVVSRYYAPPDAAGAQDDPFAGRLPVPPDCEVLWQYHIADGGPQRNCVSIGYDDQYVWSGGWYGGGKLFDMNGDGTPLWEFDRERGFGVAAAADADIFYGAWYDDRNGGFEVYRFHASSPTPDWAWNGGAAGYAPYSVDRPGRMACSDDGSVLAVGGNDGDSLAIMFFSDDSPEPFSIYEDEDLAYSPRQLRLTADGSKCIFRAHATLYRVDVATTVLEDTYDLSASTDCFGVSPDGSVVVYGFGGMNVLEWNGDRYEHRWYYYHPSSNYAGVADVAHDNEEIVVVWYATSYLQNWVTRFNFSDGPEPVWVYETNPGGGDYQDVPVWIELSDDGEWIAVGYWGDQTDANPEVQILKDSKPDGLWFGIDTPGSVFGVDLSPAGEYVVSAGKGVHANQMGSGGDVFAGYIDAESDLEVTLFEAEPVEEGVLLRWSAEDAVGVEIFRDRFAVTQDALKSRGIYLDKGLETGSAYSYMLRAYGEGGGYVEIGPIEVSYTPHWEGLWLSEPYPSPVSVAVNFAYNLPEEGRVELSVYDLSGRRVATLVNGEQTAGGHTVTWSCERAASGVYLCRLTAGAESILRRLVIAR